MICSEQIDHCCKATVFSSLIV